MSAIAGPFRQPSAPLSEEAKVAAFAAHCARTIHLLGEPPVAEYIQMTEIDPLKAKYRQLFGREPSGATIVRIVARDCLHELGDGWAAHIMLQPPDFLLKAIEICGVESRVRYARDMPNCGAPPDMEVRQWRLH